MLILILYKTDKLKVLLSLLFLYHTPGSGGIKTKQTNTTLSACYFKVIILLWKTNASCLFIFLAIELVLSYTTHTKFRMTDIYASNKRTVNHHGENICTLTQLMRPRLTSCLVMKFWNSVRVSVGMVNEQTRWFLWQGAIRYISEYFASNKCNSDFRIIVYEMKNYHVCAHFDPKFDYPLI